jgi:hypothetical protein
MRLGAGDESDPLAHPVMVSRFRQPAPLGQGIGRAPVRPVGGLHKGAEGVLSAGTDAARACFAPRSGGAGRAHSLI